MKAFSALFAELDGTSSTTAKLEALETYFRSAPPADGAWALALLLGKRRKRLITGRRLREICLTALALPDWLFEACSNQVGDSAETVSLLWGQHQTDPPRQAPERSLGDWMEQVLPKLAAAEGKEQEAAVIGCWQTLPNSELLLINKLLSGGFRVGVSTGLVTRGVARSADLDEALIAHRLMGGFTPSAESFTALTAAASDGDALAARPYPFFLASPIELEQIQQTPADQWQLEWKWDGIRGQLIHRSGGCSLWSRGEDLINEAFPELISLAETLPQGTVLDGEVLIWQAEAPAPEPFATLQRRLGRKAPSRTLQKQCPAAFMAYDLLELEGELSEALAERQRIDADLQLTELRAPIDGTVLRLNSRPGERPGEDGVLELAASEHMQALLEVYESDINRVRLGQSVTLTSENGGFSGQLSGRVVRISPQVRQRQVLSTDPTQDADARIVEVRVELDPEDARRVRRLTGLKVIARLQP